MREKLDTSQWKTRGEAPCGLCPLGYLPCLQDQQDLLMGAQCIGQAAAVFVAHHAKLQVHAVVPVVPAASGRLQCIVSAGCYEGDRAADGVLTLPEELVDPGTGIFDPRTFRVEKICHATFDIPASP